MSETRITAGGQPRVLNVAADPPDIRDRMYEPALIPLAARREPPSGLAILDQGREGACTGYGLAAVINLLLAEQGQPGRQVSARMLYEMAKRHDEWPGSDYQGSSCRGAIRGWKNMGVCEEAEWPSRAGGDLTVERAMAARATTLGAYYRLRPEVVDYHAALNEAGVIFVSARIHAGWRAPSGSPARIRPSSRSIGGHAFAIVGYDADGFVVQNSWGPGWGDEGLAVWTYQDWLASVTDGWVVQLALPTPQIFGVGPGTRRGPGGELPSDEERERLFGRPAPKRIEIAGHFVHFDDGRFKSRGDYWSELGDIEQTAERLAASPRYGRLLVYAHGGLNSPKDSARRIRALKAGFKRNGVYPFHIMYDTGLAEEIGDVVRRALLGAEARAGGFSDWTDSLIEAAVRKPGTAIWEEMKRDARTPFRRNGDGTRAIAAFAERLAATGKEIHLAGHSTGAIVIGHLLDCLERRGLEVSVESLSLFAPACRVDFFTRHYLPYLEGSAAHVRIARLRVYNLVDALERADHVALAYRKSLLYLVSRAFERAADVPLLGMQRYSEEIGTVPPGTFVYSNGRSGARARSTTHGGFDNDRRSLNDVLATVLGRAPPRPFTDQEMRGY